MLGRLKTHVVAGKLWCPPLGSVAKLPMHSRTAAYFISTRPLTEMLALKTQPQPPQCHRVANYAASSTVEPVVSRASSARWASAASFSA